MNLRSYAVTGEQRYLSARRNELVEPDELVYEVLVTRSSERINFKQGAMLE